MLSDIKWSVLGYGDIDSLGNFLATSLGDVKVVAEFNEVSDTLTILVDQGSLQIAKEAFSF